MDASYNQVSETLTFLKQTKPKSTKMFIAFLISSRRFIIVMDKWVKCPEINQKPTLAFFSPNPNDEANFDLDVKYLFNKNEAHVYNGFVMRSFESKDEAEKYIEWKRKVFPQKYENRLKKELATAHNAVEFIELTDSEPEEEHDVSAEEFRIVNHINYDYLIYETSIGVGENGAHSALMAEHQPEAAAATESSMAIQNKINQDVDENERTLASALIKKENEIQTLRETLEKLNLYLGDELVVGSSGESDVEDNISAPSVLNTRHYQLDSLFAPKYYFIMNTTGHRLYLDGELKIKLTTIQRLKAMNSVYPHINENFDVTFLFHLLRAIFTDQDLELCSKNSTIKHLNRPKLKFAKSVFEDRTENDKQRAKAFKNHTIAIGKHLLDSTGPQPNSTLNDPTKAERK